MTLVEALPKDPVTGDIVLDPGGQENGVEITGFVSVAWFKNRYPELASAATPLTDEQFAELKGIDSYWERNAERWRSKGLI